MQLKFQFFFLNVLKTGLVPYKLFLKDQIRTMCGDVISVLC